MAPGSRTTDGGVSGTHTRQFLPIFAAPSTGKTKNTLTRKLKPVACWRIDDLRFAFDSSIIGPEASEEFSGLADLWASTSHAPLSVFGHADPVGDDGYNKVLSGRRAQAVYAVLTRNVDLWEHLYSQPAGGDSWGVRSIQMMLARLGYYAGATNGQQTGETTAAIKAFQAGDNDRDKTQDLDPANPDPGGPPPDDPPLSVDGAMGPASRKALFRAYMSSICRKGDGTAFVLLKTQFLNKGIDAALLGDVQGCSEFNPILVFSSSQSADFQKPARKEARDAANATNRRVVVFLYPPGSELTPGEWPCPTADGGIAGCKAQFWADADKRRNPQEKRRKYAETGDTFACRFYDEMARRSPCEMTRTTLDVQILGPDKQPLENAPYALLIGDSVRRGTSGKGGWVHEQNVFAPSRCVLRWDMPPDPDADPPSAPGPARAADGSDLPFGVEAFIDYDKKDDDDVDEGARRRLHNLGYNAATLADNVLQFQVDFQVAQNPWFDEPTWTKLKDVHDHDAETS